MSNNLLVSVFCLTYNHAPYIRKALEGILAQKTEFPYEIVIHDDASTDGTADIIRDYESKYPGVIVPVYQIENQYGRKNVLEKCAFPLIRGKYTALCEGDDYWIADNKLQKQISYMEQHPDCSMTFHGADYEVDGVIVCNDKRAEEERDFPFLDFVVKGGTFCATASLCCRTEYFKVTPPFKPQSMLIGDYPMQIWMALNGRVHYFPEIMSVYNATHPGSYTADWEKNKDCIRKTHFDVMEMLMRIDEYTNHIYREAIQERMARCIKHVYFTGYCSLTEVIDWTCDIPWRVWEEVLQL